MPWKRDPAVAASGISPKEYADAVREGMQAGGASKAVARKAGAKAYKSAGGGTTTRTRKTTTEQ